MKYPDACIILFARVPLAGQVKTRLIPALGAQGACLLHERLLQEVLGLVASQQLCHVELWLDQAGEHPLLSKLSFPTYVQQGADLGERLSDAARSGFARHQQLLFIGADCPAMDEPYLEAALLHLQADKQVVLGPALDGGYVLLGMNGKYLALFADINWGSAQVLQQTLDMADQQQLKYALLKPLPDIDRPDDLKYFS